MWYIDEEPTVFGEDAFGSLDITRGGQFTSGGVSIAGLPWESRPGAAGAVTVDGVGSTWIAEGDLNVGYSGPGSLAVTGGGQVATNGDAYLGCEENATGTISIDGAGSAWSIDGELTVGERGAGSLAISDGGQVTSDAAFVGGQGTSSESSPSGEVTVDGIGSAWTINGDLWMGRDGPGSLTITAGGQVSSAKVDATNSPLTVDGAGSTLICTGELISRSADLNITNGAQVQSVAGSVVDGAATVDGADSSWTISADLALTWYGSLTISNGGTVDVAGDLQVQGTTALPPINEINLAGGTLRLHDSDLGITPSGHGSVAFHFTGGRLEGVDEFYIGAPLVQSGGTLAPGNGVSTTLIDDGYTLDAGALEIEINGLGGPGIDWDLLRVHDFVDLVGDNGLLDGMLNVILGYAPSPGDEYLIVINHGGDPVIGSFATGPAVRAAYGDSLYAFAIDYAAGDGNDIVLTSLGAVGLVGDYNGDATVDAADYTVWRDTLGAHAAPYFAADGNGNGLVDEADYAVWENRFGAAAATSLVGGEVPEPSAALLLVLGLVGAVRHLRQRRPRRL